MLPLLDVPGAWGKALTPFPKGDSQIVICCVRSIYARQAGLVVKQAMTFTEYGRILWEMMPSIGIPTVHGWQNPWRECSMSERFYAI